MWTPLKLVDWAPGTNIIFEIIGPPNFKNQVEIIMWTLKLVDPPIHIIINCSPCN